MNKKDNEVLFNRRLLIKAAFGLSFATGMPLFCSSQDNEEKQLSAVLHIDLNGHQKLVNRKVLGAGLMFPPFGAVHSVASSIFGRDTSVRLWPGNLLDEDFEERMSILAALKPSQVLSFTERNGHDDEKIRYVSSDNNNLEDYQSPETVVSAIKWILSRFDKARYELKGKLHWEAWNEPQFKKNGDWDANEFGRYINEVATIVKSLKLPVSIGAPLHMDDPSWNDRLCKALDPKLVDFLVNHYYSFWSDVEKPTNDFSVRAGLGVVLRDRVKRDLLLVSEFGETSWKLHCSEWNLHPPNYNPPYSTTTDMAAALHAFSALKIFLEENLESAQYFVLSSKDHFGAFSLSQNGNIDIHKTGAVLKLINECSYGKLVQSDVTSPSYSIKMYYKISDAHKSYQIPYLESVVYLWDDGTLKILLSNKHESKPINAKIQGIQLPKEVNLHEISKDINREYISGESNKISIINEENTIIIPPASIISLTLNSLKL
jgi:hypothetical protein